jgi:hypothetical protein
MTAGRFAVSGVVLLAGLASLFLVWLDLESPLRALITIGFSVTGPGWAVVQVLRIRDPLQELVLTFAVSLAILGLVSGASVYLDRWSPGQVLAVLVVITGIALAVNPIRLLASATEPQPDRHQEGS